MKLNPNKFKEEIVNRMVSKFTHDDCPQKGNACFHMAIGAPFQQCQYFKSEEDKPTAECTYEKTDSAK